MSVVQCAVAVVGEGDTSDDVIADSTVIAVVNSSPIKYSAIRVSPDAVKNRFVFETGRAPIDDEDLAQMDQIRQSYEDKNLTDYICGVIRSQQIVAFGISVSDAEAKRRWENLILERDPRATRVALQKKLGLLSSCLEDVYEHSKNADRVFEDKLSGIMTHQEWRSFVQQYASSERRARLKNLLQGKLDFDAEAKDEARSILIQERLNKAIEEDLARSDPEFKEYIRLAKADPMNRKVQDKGRNYVLRKRKAWWEQRYQEAHVVILNTRFDASWSERIRSEVQR